MYDDDDIEEYIPPIIERVQNIGGSAAAPGTGEFHKYKALRRKEVLAELMAEKAEKKRKMQEDFEKDKKEKQNILDEKALKKKRKREKKKIKKKMNRLASVYIITGQIGEAKLLQEKALNIPLKVKDCVAISEEESMQLYKILNKIIFGMEKEKENGNDQNK